MSGRFVVLEAWSTGADEHTAHDTLDAALDHRDELRKTHPRGSTGPAFFVYDREDEERGYLDWDTDFEPGMDSTANVRAALATLRRGTT